MRLFSRENLVSVACVLALSFAIQIVAVSIFHRPDIASGASPLALVVVVLGRWLMVLHAQKSSWEGNLPDQKKDKQGKAV